MDEELTYADGIRNRVHERLICERLGIDPDKTSELTIELMPGRGAIVRWAGLQRVPLDKVAELIAPPGEPS
jgi:hypothetical protein